MLTPALTREQVASRYACSHAELGRLLRERRAPLPVRIEGAILWYHDEIETAATAVQNILTRRRKAA
jgi:predicted DNA-binding transcriptional regulator AlpA